MKTKMIKRIGLSILVVIQCNYIWAVDLNQWKDIPFKTKNLSNDMFNELLHNSRPPHLFKLAYSANDQVCNKILTQMNEGGVQQDTYYISNWWLSNKYSPQWNFVIGEMDKSPRIEFAEVDIDGDGKVETIYRDVGILSSMETNRISIFDKQLSIEKYYFMQSSDQKNTEKFKEAIKLIYENHKAVDGWSADLNFSKQKMIDHLFNGKRPAGLQALWGGDMVNEVILVDNIGYLMEVSYQPFFEYSDILIYQPLRDGDIRITCGLSPIIFFKYNYK